MLNDSTFLSHLPKANSHKFLLALSGGIDSVCLFYLLKKNKVQFEVAHCNFMLRGDESNSDENFVQELCNTNNIQLHILKIDTNEYAQKNKLSIQEAAREIRYNYFYEILNQKKLDAILVAHNKNDAVETSLFNYFRGTGIKGIAGIAKTNQKIIRPFLHFSRKEIAQYANENNIIWREDSSNSKTYYSRNFIRHEIVPAVEKLFPNYEQNIFFTLNNLQDALSIYENTIQKTIKRIVDKRNNELYIAINLLKKQQYKETLLFEILKRYNFSPSQVQEALTIIDSQSGKFIENEKYKIVKYNNFLILAEKQSELSTYVLINEEHKEITSNNFKLLISTTNAEEKINKSSSFAYLNKKQIEFPLTLRKWKQGDYFYPLGMQKKKKVARFLIDSKIPLHEKENVWVLESNKKIIWLVGMRIDNRFKIETNTKEVLKIQIS